MKRAVVLSGGGAYGAYSAGVLHALVHGHSPATVHRPLVPDLLSGTSVGSFNAAFLASHWARAGGPVAVDELVALWRERLADNGRGNGVYRVRGDPFELFHPAKLLADPVAPFLTLARDGLHLTWDALNRTAHLLIDPDDESIEQRLAEMIDLSVLLSTEPLRETLREALDCGCIGRSPIKLRIAATNWTTGKLRLFTNRDMTAERTPGIISASSAAPGIFQPHPIDDAIYVDGGVLMNTPLRPALEENAREIHVVILESDIRNVPLKTLSSSLGTLHRMQMIAWAALVRDDVEQVRDFNAAMEAFEHLSARLNVGGAEDVDLEREEQRLLERLGRIAGLESEELDFLRDLAPYCVHNYFPRAGATGGGPLGYLNFRRGRIDALIEAGYRDAVEHDCVACGCILPAAGATAGAAAATRATEGVA